MKKALLLCAIVALAVPAMADLVPPDNRANLPIITPSSWVPLGEGGPRVGPAVYDSIGPGTAGYIADPTPAAVGSLGWDDYDTISGVNLTAAKFVGGGTAAGAVFWFDFFTYTGFTPGSNPTGMSYASGFGVVLPQAGNWIWTITFSAPPFVIPHTGLMQITANSTYTPYPTTIAGQWFLTSPDAVIVGTNLISHGGDPGQLVKCFAFHIPEPTTLALLGLGLGVVLIRRR